jgi:hypothetical protein
MNRNSRLVAGLASLLAVCAAVSSASTAAAYRGGGYRGGDGGAHVQNARSNVSSNHNINDNVNRNTNVNRNANVNVNRNVDVNVHGGYGYGGGYDRWGHPIATAAAVTATAVAVGTMAATLPSSGCSGISVAGVAYQHCGANYYQPVYQGGGVQYVVVAAPQ